MPRTNKTLSEHDRITALETAFDALSVKLAGSGGAGFVTDAPGAFVSHNYSFGGAERLGRRNTCVYADKEYSVGSVLCQVGKKYTCTATGWTKVSPEEAC